MRLLFGLATALLGTTLLASGAVAQNNNSNSPPPPHPHFSTGGHGHDSYAGAPNGQRTQPQNLPPNSNFGPSAEKHTNPHSGNWGGNWSGQGGQPRSLTPNTDFGANAGGHPYPPNRNWSGRWSGQHDSHAGNTASRNPGYRWNPSTLRDHNISHWSAQDRTHWQQGHWWHGRRDGRDGWWWYTSGVWFFYTQPVYPYPIYVSDYYYDDYYYDDGYPDDEYGDEYAANPDDNGYYWYYCNDPAGYYPYVQSCRGPWRTVSPTPDMQQGPDQDQAPDADSNDDQGPPPQDYNDNNPPQSGDQYNGPDNGQNGSPPGYPDDNGRSP